MSCLLGNAAVGIAPSTGTVTEGGKFYLFTVSNFLHGQALQKDVLSLTIRRLESDADPHFMATTPILNSTIFYDYANPISPISHIIRKLLWAFDLFDDLLFKLLNDASFERFYN
jgi:hypothetical protein